MTIPRVPQEVEGDGAIFKVTRAAGPCGLCDRACLSANPEPATIFILQHSWVTRRAFLRFLDPTPGNTVTRLYQPFL